MVGIWPALTYEERVWTPSTIYAGRQAAFDRIRPYNAAIAADIAARPVDLAPSTAALVAEATAEIARFDAEFGPELAPFGALLLRSESAASSQIENLTASARSVLLAEAGDTSKLTATLVAANTSSTAAAIALADRLDDASIIEMQRALLGGVQPKLTGAYRTEQVWIGGRSGSPHSADFVPPHHDRVPAAMADLIRFLRRTDVVPFAQAMVGHAQFETIHPFPDGNGRTGRALIHATLRAAGVTRSVTVPVSAGLLADTSAYFAALDAYRSGDLEPIILRAADAAFEAMHNGRLLAADLRQITEGWAQALGDLRSHALARRIVIDLPRTPVLDLISVEATYKVARTTANEALAQLAERQIISRANSGQRFRKWIALDIAEALDNFASRSRRRG